MSNRAQTSPTRAYFLFMSIKPHAYVIESTANERPGKQKGFPESNFSRMVGRDPTSFVLIHLCNRYLSFYDP